MPFGATPSRWCVCHFTTSAECAKTNYTIWAADFAPGGGCAQGASPATDSIDPSVTAETYAGGRGYNSKSLLTI